MMLPFGICSTLPPFVVFQWLSTLRLWRVGWGGCICAYSPSLATKVPILQEQWILTFCCSFVVLLFFSFKSLLRVWARVLPAMTVPAAVAANPPTPMSAPMPHSIGVAIISTELGSHADDGISLWEGRRRCSVFRWKEIVLKGFGMGERGEGWLLSEPPDQVRTQCLRYESQSLLADQMFTRLHQLTGVLAICGLVHRWFGNSSTLHWPDSIVKGKQGWKLQDVSRKMSPSSCAKWWRPWTGAQTKLIKCQRVPRDFHTSQRNIAHHGVACSS